MDINYSEITIKLIHNKDKSDPSGWDFNDLMDIDPGNEIILETKVVSRKASAGEIETFKNETKDLWDDNDLEEGEAGADED